MPNRTSSIKVAVEGPYGEHSPGHRCRNLVYVAGGNGIPGLYSECVDLDKKLQRIRLLNWFGLFVIGNLFLGLLMN